MDSLDQPPTWPTRVAQKRQERAGKIPLEWRISDEFKATYRTPFSEQTNDLIRTQAIRKSGILTERELEITEDYTVQSLLAALADGTFTSVEVTVAYSKRAAVAQQLVSCLTETMFEEAQERAKYLDNLRSRGQLAGPLHGLPISIKDNFHYKGTESTIGMVAFLDEVSEKHSPLVDILLKLGAVLYVKTNVPQTMMTCESHNNIFQRTLNPWNTSLGPGGSSGGEGALIALRGSPLGVGTDIGGSVRIPALCCGTYGFRPSAARIPNGEMRTCNTPGLKFILSCAGPLSLDLDGIELFFRSVLGAQPALYDSTIIDIPWRQVPGKSILRIGVIPEDPLFPLHPPVKRALAEATSILEAQGHQVIRLDARDAKVGEIAEVAWNIFSLDPSAGNHLKASRDPPVPGLVHILKESERLKAFYTPTLPDMNEMDRLGKLGVLNARRAQLREEYRKLWVRHELDVCIAPPAQSTAVPHDLFGMPPYTVLLNLLDYPSCIIPFGCVDEADSRETFEIREDQVAAPFNYEQLKGAPRSIQVFTTTMRDEECLQIAKQIDQCLKGTK